MQTVLRTYLRLPIPEQLPQKNFFSIGKQGSSPFQEGVFQAVQQKRAASYETALLVSG